jgi:hypothetical protein
LIFQFRASLADLVWETDIDIFLRDLFKRVARRFRRVAHFDLKGQQSWDDDAQLVNDYMMTNGFGHLPLKTGTDVRDRMLKIRNNYRRVSFFFVSFLHVTNDTLFSGI